MGGSSNSDLFQVNFVRAVRFYMEHGPGVIQNETNTSTGIALVVNGETVQLECAKKRSPICCHCTTNIAVRLA